MYFRSVCSSSVHLYVLAISVSHVISHDPHNTQTKQSLNQHTVFVLRSLSEWPMFVAIAIHSTPFIYATFHTSLIILVGKALFGCFRGEQGTAEYTGQ